MLAKIRSITEKAPLLREAPSLTAAMAIAELFYRFHSFTLECVAFLATWYALSRLGSALFAGRPAAGTPAAGTPARASTLRESSSVCGR